ncbi:MAG: tRNA (adenosine(37)-N6)-threonylcarbamoyltransferase complex ATPase subunit type 1 TsaE [Candidatus Methylomirabilales bacterium]
MAGARRKKINLISTSPAETQRVGMWVGRHLKPGDVVCLKGEMGAGKTVFTRGIAAGLGVPRGQRVRSPTFTLVHEYMGRHPIYHIDLYRIRGEEELEGIGWEEYLYGAGVAVIEAAERLETRLPKDRLDIVLERDGLQRRRLTMVGYGHHFESLVQALVKQRR